MKKIFRQKLAGLIFIVVGVKETVKSFFKRLKK